MANLTLAHCDNYLDYIRAGVKQDTLNALRNAPLHMQSLFPDQVLMKAEEEVSRSEERRSSSTNRKPVFTLMLPPANHLTRWTGSPVFRLGNKSGTDNKARKDVTRQPTSRDRQHGKKGCDQATYQQKQGSEQRK